MIRNFLVLLTICVVSVSNSFGQCISGTNSVCVNETANFEYTGDSRKITWSISGEGTIHGSPTSKSISVTWTEPGNHKVYLKDMVDTNGDQCTLNVEVKGAKGGNLSTDNPSVCPGDDVTLTLSGHVGNIQKWQKSVNEGAWQDIEHTSTTYTDKNLQNTTRYRVFLSDCNEQDISTIESVTVNKPANLSVTGSTTFCTGESTTVTFEVKDSNRTIKSWEKSEYINEKWTSWQTVSSNSSDNTFEYTTSKPTRIRAVELVGCLLPTDYIEINEVPGTVAGNISIDKSADKVCPGELFTLSVTGNTGSIEQWWYKKDAQHSWTEISSPTDLSIASGYTSHSYKAEIKNGNCQTKETPSFDVSIKPVSIQGFSTTSQQICDGEQFTLSVSDYEGIKIKWQKSVDDANWITIAETTAKTFSYSDQHADALYRAVAINDCGMTDKSSTLNVSIKHPEGGIIRSSSSAVCPGGSATLTVEGYDGNIERWEKSVVGGSWEPVTHTSATYTAENITATTSYKAIITRCNEETESEATTVAVETAGEISVTGGNLKYCTGESTTVNFALNGYSGRITSWEKSEYIDGSWTSFTSVLSNPSDNTFQYTVNTPTRIRAEVMATCKLESDYIEMNETPGTIPGRISIDKDEAKVCAGESLTLSVIENQGEVIQWWHKEDEQHGWTPIASVKNLKITDNKIHYYKAEVKNGNCKVKETPSFEVSVKPIDIGSFYVVPKAICKGESVSFYIQDYIGEKIKWQKSDDDGVNWTTVHESIEKEFSYDQQNSTSLWRAVAVNDCEQTASTTPVKVKVLTPETVPVTTDITICSGSQAVLSVDNPQPSSIEYHWYKASEGTIDLVAITDVNEYKTAKINAQSTYYVAFAENGCAGSKTPLEISVYDEVQAAAAPTTEIKFDPYAVELYKNNPSDATTTYYWQTRSDGQDESSSAETLSDPSSGFYYVRGKSNNGCWGDASESVEVVNHNPTSYNYDGESVNYVRSFALKERSTEISYPEDLFTETDPDKLQTTTQYFDGLGRPLQEVVKQGSPNDRHDLVTPAEYNAIGRKVRDYLPYVANTQSGELQTNPIVDQRNFYQTETQVAHSYFPFNYRDLERSPLDRVLNAHAPGKVWSGHVNTDREHASARHIMNNTTEDKVVQWELDNTGVPKVDQFYDAGDLRLIESEDEEGNTVKEFINKEGQTILKRVQANEEQTIWAETYYIYDDFGNLRYVLQPKLVNRISENIELEFTIPTDKLNKLAFQYKYDGRQRMIEKRVPGADWVHMVYDDRDRLILTQDGNQREDDQWLFTKYDALNRPVATGILNDDRNRAAMQTDVEDSIGADKYYAWYESVDEDGVHGYDNASFPDVSNAGQYHTVTYYDNYDFLENDADYFDAEGLDFTYDNSVRTTIDYPDTENTTVKGQQTGSKVKVLDPQGGSLFLNTVTYYDDRYRVIQTVTENHLGGTERQTSCFDDLTKNVKETVTQASEPEPLTIQRKFNYDHVGRLLDIQHSTDGSPFVTIAKNEYNELGELIQKDLHTDGDDDPWQTVDYQYNIRGWLTSINDANLSSTGDLFGMELYYTDGFEEQYYNGNISGVKWQTVVDDDHMAYGYKYDKLNRITSAHYVKGPKKADDTFEDEGYYNLEILPKDGNTSGYDLNGNILNLKRYGTIDNNPAAIDVLDYSYDGNQLTQVDDAGTNEGFKDGDNTGIDYEYDDNGNMYIDRNKEIEDIDYNFLNLPKVITFKPKDGVTRKIEYIYDAAGIKLAQKVYEDATQSPTKTTDYIGERIYETKDNDPIELQFIHHEEGRIVEEMNDDGAMEWKYQYFLKDHLGNTRLTFGEEKSEEYILTMEIETPENRLIEDEEFENVNITEDNKLPDLNHTPVTSETPSPEYSVFLDGTTRIIGPGKSLKVLPGDKVEMSVYAKYLHADGGYDPSVAGDMLLSGFSGAFVDVGGEMLKAKGYVDEGLLTGLDNIANNGNDYAGVPQAYLNYIVFDKDYNVIEGKKLQVSEEGKVTVGNETVGDHEHLQIDPITISEEGYVYIYLSNQTPDSEVYFDDLYIKHTKSRVLESTAYYPFGLELEGLSTSREHMIAQRFKYNGKELQDDFDLNWYDYGARMYMPDIARWGVIDPAIENDHYEWSPYVYTYNNPIRFIDPIGLDSADAIDLTNAAENAVETVKENDPEGTPPARCSTGVRCAFKELTGSEEFDGKLANDMYDHMSSNDDWEEVELEDVQELANDGQIIVGSSKNENGSGHVVLAVPGEEQYSSSWDGDVPVVMDTGHDKRTSKKAVSYSWTGSSKDSVKWFKYKNSNADKVYDGRTLENVTVVAKGSVYLKKKGL